jgi:Flp pilus assembly protein TadG
MRPQAETPRNERGVILIWVAMFLITVMAFMSLGIDLSKLMATRTQLQNAADAAALAGASAVNPTTGALDPDTVMTRAQLAASENKAFIDGPEPVVVASGDVQIIGGTQVKVTARREGANSMVTYVAQVLGIESLDMKASATAAVVPAGGVTCGVVPLGVVPPAGGFTTGCTPGYSLKSSSGTLGNYGPVSFPECDTGECAGMASTGANTFRCLVHYGYCCPINVGDQVYSEPGNLSSFRAAVLDRFKDDTDQRQGICYSAYHGNGKRIAILPVVTAMGSGRTQVTVTRFAAFFIKNVPGTGVNSSLDGEFIYYVVAGTTGSTSGTGPVAYTIKLVN